MTPTPQEQLIRLASDNTSIYEDARDWFRQQGSARVPTLLEGLENDRLGLVCHWRILLLLREFALPSTLPAILAAFRKAFARKDPIVLPGALEALAAFPSEEATAALITVAISGQPDDVIHAAALLGARPGDRVVEALASLLAHENRTVRKNAVKSLVQNNSSKAREALRARRAVEKDPEVLALFP